MPLEPPEDEGVDPLAGEGEIAGEKEAGEEQVSLSQAEPAEQRQSPSLEEKIEEMDEAIEDVKEKAKKKQKRPQRAAHQTANAAFSAGWIKRS